MPLSRFTLGKSCQNTYINKGRMVSKSGLFGTSVIGIELDDNRFKKVVDRIGFR
jgi:hypothetical protein